MISAIVSVLVTCSQPFNYALAVVGVFIVAFLWYILAQVVSGPQIGELVENRRFGPAFWCNIAIIVVNLVVALIFCANNGDCSAAVGGLWNVLTG